MEPKTQIDVFIKVDSLKLKEELTDVYIYQDFNTKTFSIFYNDEIKFPINLEKAFWKKYGKIKNYFSLLKDIKVDFNIKDNLVRLTYILEKGI